jgi:hypothetical protein
VGIAAAAATDDGVAVVGSVVLLLFAVVVDDDAGEFGTFKHNLKDRPERACLPVTQCTENPALLINAARTFGRDEGGREMGWWRTTFSEYGWLLFVIVGRMEEESLRAVEGGEEEGADDDDDEDADDDDDDVDDDS